MNRNISEFKVLTYSCFFFFFRGHFPGQQVHRVLPLNFEGRPRIGLLDPDSSNFSHFPDGPIANPSLQSFFLPPIILPVLEPDSSKSTHLGSEFPSDGNSTNLLFPQVGTVIQVSLNLILFSSQLVGSQRVSESSEVMYCSPSLHGPCRNSW